MENFKKDSIELIASGLALQIGCTLIEAVTKMQATAARNSNDGMLSDLCDYKSTLIAAL